jgi:phosphatidylglycerophosphate synthase
MSATQPVVSGMAVTPGVGATYKAREVEETFDVWFYRPLGYQIARAAWRLGLTPNAVTAMGGLLGILAGHFFLYRGWVPSVRGIALLVASEAFDSADGQLARLSGQYSKLGRILDGLSSNLVFASIYLHLAIRIAGELGTLTAIGLILVAAVSHSMQSSVADYYRNAFLYLGGVGRAELDEASLVEADYRALSWLRDLAHKLVLRLYLNYTRQQEMLTHSFRALRREVAASYPEARPAWLAKAYRETNRPLLKYYNILTTNTRMFVLGVAVCTDRPLLYLGFEIVFLNALLVWVSSVQNRNNERLLAEVRGARPSARGS